MRTLSDTIDRLAAFRAMRRKDGAGHTDRLSEMPRFGSNPGALRALTYAPAGLQAGAALVVVLHGCTQTAADYDAGSGWSALADQFGFALLFPEQQRANNPNLCFNWFLPEDIRRDGGEALSIRQMIDEVGRLHAIDPRRIFITGLSAGGAMTSVMLATYPDVFAGGAIIAGLPYGCASTVPEAFDRMRGHGGPTDQELQALVRAASPHAGPWPRLSIWHGSSDRTVVPSNMKAILSQWRALHGVPAEPTRSDQVNGHPRRAWDDAAGRECIEEYRILGMGHGTPIATDGAEGSGVRGPYMLDMEISSTRQIARFWGLSPRTDGRARGSDAAFRLPPPTRALGEGPPGTGAPRARQHHGRHF